MTPALSQSPPLRVLLLSRYERKGASSRLRFLQYLPGLEARNIHVTPAPFFDDIYLSRCYAGQRPRFDHIAQYYARRVKQLWSLQGYDAIWLEKEALPWLPAWLEERWLCRIPYVLDIDDAWFYRYNGHRFSLIRHTLGTKLESLVRNAAAVVVSNNFLEDWAYSSGAQQVVQLPTVVDLARYNSSRSGSPNGVFRIGWIGSPSSALYLQGVADALREVCAQLGTRLCLVGVGEGFELADVAVERRPWAEQREVDDLASFAVGIAPLSDGPWERGKCSFKIIQYMAAALPVVASRVGIHADIVKDGETGFLVGTEREWIDALTRLRSDPALRRRMGEAGRALVRERYSLDTNVDRLAETLREACRGTAMARESAVMLDGRHNR